MVARRFSSIFYFRVRWSALEPQEGQYAWNHDENIKALLQGALDRGLKLAFCVYVDGQDNIENATPDFVREAGAQGYASHRLWDPEDVYNNWTPYADGGVKAIISNISIRSIKLLCFSGLRIFMAIVSRM